MKEWGHVYGYKAKIKQLCELHFISVDLPPFLYLDNAGLSPTEADAVYARFQQEYQSACDFVFTMTGTDDLLWFRPWLKESIYLRSPMIHPINLVQILAFKEKDYALLRESVTGIASGMLTTG